MLTAATIVARRLNRNRKIVMTANRAPRPPSRSSPSVDSLMKSDEVRDDRDLELVGMAGGDLVELGRDRVGDEDRVRVTGLGDRERQRRRPFVLA